MQFYGQRVFRIPAIGKNQSNNSRNLFRSPVADQCLNGIFIELIPLHFIREVCRIFVASLLAVDIVTEPVRLNALTVIQYQLCVKVSLKIGCETHAGLSPCNHMT
jgi:hypothetical protein